MPRLLCHLLLVFCLVLAGIGSAMASVAMHAMPAPHDAAAQLAGTAGGDHCGDAATTVHANEPAPQDCDDDCCSGAGGCACACIQAAQCLAFAVMALAPIAPSAQAVMLPTHDHPAPPAARDIRPPIDQA